MNLPFLSLSRTDRTGRGRLHRGCPGHPDHPPGGGGEEAAGHCAHVQEEEGPPHQAQGGCPGGVRGALRIAPASENPLLNLIIHFT